MLLLLFFREVSSEFRDHYEELEPETQGIGVGHDVRIRSLLETLCSSRTGVTIQSISRFGADAPLFACHLLRMSRVNEQRASILDLEVHLHRRILSWIGGVTLSFPVDDPCPKEWPA